MLFICTGNSERSPAAEKYFRDWKGIWETRSAGIDPVYGGTALSQELVDWADLIVCMEEKHQEFLRAYFNCPMGKVEVADIADQYLRDDPQLIKELDRRARPILEKAAGRA